MSGLPRVCIIILNWNGLGHTMKCLDSLKSTTYAASDVVLVDNGSAGDDVIVLEERYGDFLRIIKNDRNWGFAKGNNIGIEYALRNLNPKYLLLLNNDTVVDPEFLTELVRVAETDAKIGSCQSKVLSLKDPRIVDGIGIGIVVRSRGLVPAYPTLALDAYPRQIGYGERDNGQYDQGREVFGAVACSALYRREMLEQIGLFDEDFFAYYEDVDLAWRARLFGWKCHYVPRSVVYHYSSATGGSFKLYYLARNQTYYVIKNASWGTVLRHMFGLALSVPVTLVSGLRLRDCRGMQTLLKGKFGILPGIPRMVQKRRRLQSKRTVGNEEVRQWFG